MGELKLNKLRELRKERKLSLSDLHEATGISVSSLSDIENGKRRMNVNHARDLAEYFGVTADYILGNDLASYMSFSAALEDLFESSFDDFVRAANGDGKKLDDRQRSLFLCVDHLLHETLTDDDLSAIDNFVMTLASKNKGR